jgi:hypothetical protein
MVKTKVYCHIYIELFNQLEFIISTSKELLKLESNKNNSNLQHIRISRLSFVFVVLYIQPKDGYNMACCILLCLPLN